jgi:hypothetical protein
MNGWHAELFTYCLYENMLKPDDGRLTLLTPVYEEKVTTEEEPGVRLSGRYHDHLASFFLEWRSDQYRISLVTPDSMPAELATALQDLGFIQTGTTFSKQCPMGEIESVRGLDVLMAE